MNKSYQLYLFIFSTTTLFTDINPKGGFSYDWFDAQSQCLGQGLTIERDKSGQPYWTGVYRRMTPWINILGCYSDSIESHQEVMKKTMKISSVGMCHEICHHANIDRFAVKMNKCLCIERGFHVSPYNRLSASYCNIQCENNSADIYLGDCGGKSAYNIYETQGVQFNSVKRCLSLQCSVGDTRFIPKKCSESFEKVCENMTLPDNGYANSWTFSMKHCKNSHPSTYLLGDFDLNDSHLVCERIPRHIQVVWVGVVRQIYTSIDQAKELLAPHFTTGNCDEAQLPSIKDTHQKSSANDNLALKISLPLILGIIILLLSAVGVVFYRRRSKMAKTDRTTKAEVESVPKSIVDSKLNPVQNHSYFVLEQCSQKIHAVNDSPNESPYNNSEDGVYDHLRDKKSRKAEVEDTYQHATDITRDMSEYDTMANTVNKKQDEGASCDYSHQDSNGNYACDLRANNHLTDNPYDVAV